VPLSRLGGPEQRNFSSLNEGKALIPTGISQFRQPDRECATLCGIHKNIDFSLLPVLRTAELFWPASASKDPYWPAKRIKRFIFFLSKVSFSFSIKNFVFFNQKFLKNFIFFNQKFHSFNIKFHFFSIFMCFQW